MTTSIVKLKRAYEPAESTDGYRVLVERLWPRGVRKEALALDDWLKDVAPTSGLRKWFAHDPEKWDEFVIRYRAELGRDPAADALRELVRRAAHGPMTLVYAARDERRNSARVLSERIRELLKGEGAPH